MVNFEPARLSRGQCVSMKSKALTGTERRQASFEKAKNKRRDDIIAAAENLIRATGSTDFSMRELAEAAGISPYTTYNLIGTKSTVLFILLNQSIDKIILQKSEGQTHTDPVEGVFAAGSTIADVFDSDAQFYRPLMRHLLGVLDPVHRPQYMKRAYEYWLAVFEPLAVIQESCGGVSATTLARTVQVYMTGTLDYWVHDEVSGTELRDQIKLGLALCLKSQNVPGWTERLDAIIQEVDPAVMRVGARMLA